MSLIILYPLEETLNQRYGMIVLFLYILYSLSVIY
jgi:hypothetical protein